MSGFVLTYHRDGTPVDRLNLTGMITTLKHRGPDGQDVSCRQNIALGHQHFWTTPEEVGERQPLWTNDGRFGLVFDGRLDNRDELLPALGLYGNAARHTSDATLVLRCYEKWDEQCFGRFLGPFALVIYDKARQRVVCARDPLGDRTLFYYLDDRIFLAASEEQALLDHPAVSDELDETTLAYYFAVRVPGDGRTFFKGVHELLPAHTLTVHVEQVRKQRYWDVDPEARLSYRSDAEYGDHFRELLDTSVRRCLRTVGRPGIMMSGGLDSASVAALAARQLVGAGRSERLCTLSWVFDHFTECDERSYMDPLVARYGLNTIRVKGDDDWPLREPFPTDVFNPGHPHVNPYHLLKRRLYQAAHDNQVRVLLTGAFGDELYSGAQDWLLDLILEHRHSEASSEFLQLVRRFGFKRVLASRSLRRVGGWLLGYEPGTQRRLRLPGVRRPEQAPWLTGYARQLLPDPDADPIIAGKARRPDQRRVLLGMYGASGATGETATASRFAIEHRYPYRDRQLIQFMLAIPAYQLYKRQRYKHILRSGMADLLPDAILSREGSTSLLPFYRYGLQQQEKLFSRVVLSAHAATWRRFVGAHWLESVPWQQLADGKDGPATLLPWRALSLEIWIQERNRRSECDIVSERTLLPDLESAATQR
jgi:asparagine synthase (glutamine-hydrolysing)